MIFSWRFNEPAPVCGRNYEEHNNLTSCFVFGQQVGNQKIARNFGVFFFQQQHVGQLHRNQQTVEKLNADLLRDNTPNSRRYKRQVHLSSKANAHVVSLLSRYAFAFGCLFCEPLTMQVGSHFSKPSLERRINAITC